MNWTLLFLSEGEEWTLNLSELYNALGSKTYAIHIIFLSLSRHHSLSLLWLWTLSVCLSWCYNQLTNLCLCCSIYTACLFRGSEGWFKAGGEGNVACDHRWGKTKTTDGLCSVFNPDSASLILSSLQECPHCMLDLTRQVTIRIGPWLSRG